jgi:hemolysin III
MSALSLFIPDEKELQEHYPSRVEHAADGWVHGVGIAAAVFGGAALAFWSWARGGVGLASATSLYAISLIVMLSFSALYNLTRPSPARRLLRRLDEAGIFFLIAGSYTPFTTQNFEGLWAVAITTFVWFAALMGGAGKLFVPKLSEKFWCGVYIAFGWMGVLALGPLLTRLSPLAISLLIAGGVTYTSGVAIFLNPRVPFRRAIWHGFVLLGAGLHYGAILAGIVWAAPVLAHVR